MACMHAWMNPPGTACRLPDRLPNRPAHHQSPILVNTLMNAPPVQLEGGGLKESDAWPAQPQDAYGLEKLVTEELCMHYEKDFGIACRTARFHNIYGGRAGGCPVRAWISGTAGCRRGSMDTAAGEAQAQRCCPAGCNLAPWLSHPPAVLFASSYAQAPTAPGRAAVRRPPPPSAARR